VKISSPLRYPGGKAALAGLLGNIRRINGLANRNMAEPFAGGAGASLTLLYLEEARKIYINDADESIHDFWWTLVNRPQPFLDSIDSTRVSMAEWRRQREIYRMGDRASRLKRGFAAFYLNRCNHSGIILNGGPIGGFKQNGEWKLGARFNKPELRKRCEKVIEFRDRIGVHKADGLHFINVLDLKSTFFFVDPPYYEKGPKLYLNSLNNDYHAALAKRLKELAHAAWVLTYDDCPEIRAMYRGWASIRPYSLRYVAASRKIGREVLITPKWMQLPATQESLAVQW